MNTNLPMPRSDTGLTRRDATTLGRARHKAEIEAFTYALAIQLASHKDQLASRALGDAVAAAYDEEVRFLRLGEEIAGNSATARELLARKLDVFSSTNNSRLSRFGS